MPTIPYELIPPAVGHSVQYLDRNKWWWPTPYSSMSSITVSLKGMTIAWAHLQCMWQPNGIGVQLVRRVMEGETPDPIQGVPAGHDYKLLGAPIYGQPPNPPQPDGNENWSAILGVQTGGYFNDEFRTLAASNFEGTIGIMALGSARIAQLRLTVTTP